MIGECGKEMTIIEVNTEMEPGVVEIKFGEVEIERISGNAEAMGALSAIENVYFIATQCVGNAAPIEDPFVDVVINEEVRVFAKASGNVNDRV